MLKAHSVAISGEVVDSLDIAAEVLFNFQASEFLLAVTIDVWDHVFLAIEEGALDFGPGGVP